MAGENPDDTRSGAADEFLSKTKWQRFQVLIAGPGDEHRPGGRRARRRALQGADVPAFAGPAGRGRRGAAGVAGGGRPACSRATGSCTVAGSAVATWEELLHGGGRRSPNARCESRDRRDGDERQTVQPRRPSAPRRRRALRDGRHRRAARRPSRHPIGEPPAIRPRRPASRPATSSGSINGERMVFASQVTEAICASAPDRPITIAVRRDGAEQTVAVTPERQRRHRPSSASALGNDDDSFTPAPLEARRHERAAQRRVLPG